MAELEDLLPLMERGPDGSHPDASPDRLKSFLFSIGGSTPSPVSCYVRIEAHTVDQALSMIQEFMPSSIETKQEMKHYPHASSVSYVLVCFGDASAIKAADIEEWHYVDDL